PFARLAVLAEVPLGADDAALVAVAAAPEGLHRDSATVQGVQDRLVIEGVDVTGTAVHEQEDDALGLGRKVRRPRGQRVDVGGRRIRGTAAEEAVRGQQAGEGQAREAGAGLPEELAAGAAA